MRQARTDRGIREPGRRRADLEARLGSRRVGGPRPSDPAVLTIEEAAAYLGVAVSTVYRSLQRRDMPGHKVGRHWRFSRQGLENWLHREAG